MPIKIVEGLPVKEKLEAEGIFTMEDSRALSQDIRPLKILILNLMPRKEVTELQLLRLLGNGPIQIEADFMYTSSHESANTTTSYLQKFYKTLDQVRDKYYDGLLVTGAPVEHLDFDQVDYIEELREIMAWAQTHVFNRYFICWGAQFALNYYYGIEKFDLPEKLFGIYPYQRLNYDHPYVRGFDDVFDVPQSRHTRVDAQALEAEEDLIILTGHPEFGPDLMTSRDGRDLFILGHLEYDRDNLQQEYERDLGRGLPIHIPESYFPHDDPSLEPAFTWQSHAHLLVSNWVNQTYQETPYHLKDLANLSDY